MDGRDAGKFPQLSIPYRGHGSACGVLCSSLVLRLAVLALATVRLQATWTTAANCQKL